MYGYSGLHSPGMGQVANQGQQQITETRWLPTNQPIRTGATDISWNPLYDTPFWGKDQKWSNSTGVELFNDADRCKNLNLCNLQSPGILSNDAEFHSFGLACEIDFHEKALWSTFNHYCRLERWRDTSLKATLWMHLIGSAGGLNWVDNNAGTYHVNKGLPSSGDYYRLFIPWIFPPGKTWKLVFKFMELYACTAAEDPTTIWNEKSGQQDEGIRLVRFFLLGKEMKDAIQ